MEVTSIYYKHYPTFKFGNETRVRQGARIPVRASLQPGVISGAKACLSPPASTASLDHFVHISDWVGERFLCTDIWWGLLTSVTHQPLACGQGEVQAPFFAQTQETATNHLKEKGLGSTQDHVPCGLYEKATLVGRNFSQLKVRKNIYATQPLCSSTRLSQAQWTETLHPIPFVCACNSQSGSCIPHSQKWTKADAANLKPEVLTLPISWEDQEETQLAAAWRLPGPAGFGKHLDLDSAQSPVYKQPLETHSWSLMALVWQPELRELEWGSS